MGLELNKIYQADCRTLVEKLPTNLLIISDPPYNIDFDYPEYDDAMSEEEYIEMFTLLQQMPCVFIHYPEEMIKYVCSGMGAPEEVVSWVYPSNINRQHRLIAWWNCKPNFSKVKQPYRNQTDKRIQQQIANGSEGTAIYDWWEIDLVKNVSSEKQPYTNQIPEEVIARIIKTTAQPGDVVVDLFNGSGTTVSVAEKLGFDWIGIDISARAVEIARKRIGGINPLFSGISATVL